MARHGNLFDEAIPSTGEIFQKLNASALERVKELAFSSLRFVMGPLCSECGCIRLIAPIEHLSGLAEDNWVDETSDEATSPDWVRIDASRGLWTPIARSVCPGCGRVDDILISDRWEKRRPSDRELMGCG
jgi:hypothetical protein